MKSINQLNYRILEYLEGSGGIPRKNVYTPFAKNNYRHFTRTLAALISEGKVELYRYKNLNHVRITEIGRACLNEHRIRQTSEAIGQKKAKPRNKKDENRLSLVNDVRGLCEGCGFLTEQKPDLVLLSHFPEQNIEEQWLKADEQGVFYTAKEIRRAYKELKGKNEIINMSRLVGVLFLKGHLSYIYAVGKKLIKWLSTNELRTIESIEDFLYGIKAIKNNSKDSSRSAIIVGRGFSLIPKIVTGRTCGESEEGKKEYFSSIRAREHINSHNLQKVFDSAYYVQASRQGVAPFRAAALLSADTRDYLVEKWYSGAVGLTGVRGAKYIQGVNRNMEKVIYLPFMDLIELEYYRNQREPAHLVVDKTVSEAVSRCLGPLCLSIRDNTGELLNPQRFDINGALLQDVPNK